ncbi:MAG TPA: acetate kinase [Candidatus Binatia bacterium]|nr:acetate kinase [Candidatus Binatia bacterium]
MRVLVLNCGSSTLKFQVIETDGRAAPRKLARGIVDRIGASAAYSFKADSGAAEEKTLAVANHEVAVRLVIDWLRSRPELGGIDAVGHRVVHGGDRFVKSVLIDDDVIAALEDLCEIAPLHNPGAVSGIRAARKILGAAVPMAAAFDTSFHHSIPEPAALYAIPYELSLKHKIRRYGFHGLAHQYDILRYAELAGKAPAQVSAVTLHLGNGCSATAIRGGQSLDTSMGFTPLEGLVMGTRSGDLDPALVSYLARKEQVDAATVENWLNKRSGLLGVSGISNDMRELTAAYQSDPRARLAVEMFCYRARKYLGAYLAVLGGAAQAVIFSGGIGENSPLVRKNILDRMEWCGVTVDEVANESVLGNDGRISAANSKLDVFVIHTDEEAIIARETARIVAAAG